MIRQHSRTPIGSRQIKRIALVATISSMLILCAVLMQLNSAARAPSAPASHPSVISGGGNPYWDMVGSMILYRNDSGAGNRSYWVAQSFTVTKPSPSSLVAALGIYVWLARDTPPSESFPAIYDNITVLLVEIANGTPDIMNALASQRISVGNVSAIGPYPQGLMQTNNSLAVQLSFTAPNPLAGFAEGEYAIFMYRENLGDNDDYHNGYAYYWAASKLDLYYGGGSWLLDTNGTWSYYPVDMCFVLLEITVP